MLPVRVVPSLLCKSKADLLMKLRRLPASQRVHVDIMDGKFVPNTSIPLSILEEPQLTQEYEVHLMVHNPLDHIKTLTRLSHKPALAIIHREACRTQAEAVYLMQHLRSSGIKAGLALNPETSLRHVSTAAAKADLVLVMTVHPGFSGQEFIASALPKLRNLRRALPGKEIEVDGGIDKNTILMAAQAGANAFVASTAIFGAVDPKTALRELEAAALPKPEAPTIRRGFGAQVNLRKM